MTRYDANMEILEIIKRYAEKNPDQRFHQILQNLGIEYEREDQWHDESTETLADARAGEFYSEN